MLSGKIIKQFLVKLPTVQGCLVSGLLFGISQDILDKKQEDNGGKRQNESRKGTRVPGKPQSRKSTAN